MRAEFHRCDAAQEALGSAEWRSGAVEVESEDDEVAAAIERIFRRTPVAVDEPSLRAQGTSGAVVLQPGSLPWFRAAALTRSSQQGLCARLVTQAQGTMGWDPAGAYRTFADTTERRERIGMLRPDSPPQAGEARRGPAT